MTLSELATRAFVLARNLKNFSLAKQHHDEIGALVADIHKYLAPKRNTTGALDENVLHAERQLIQANAEIEHARTNDQQISNQTVKKIATAAEHLRKASQ